MRNRSFCFPTQQLSHPIRISTYAARSAIGDDSYLLIVVADIKLTIPLQLGLEISGLGWLRETEIIMYDLIGGGGFWPMLVLRPLLLK